MGRISLFYPFPPFPSPPLLNLSFLSKLSNKALEDMCCGAQFYFILFLIVL
jgi:hypothetical protein